MKCFERAVDGFKAVLGIGSLVVVGAAGPAFGQSEVAEPSVETMGRSTTEELPDQQPIPDAGATKVSGVLGADYNTHFISYGFDVWGVGNDFGDDATFNPYAEVTIDFDAFTFTIGSWWDVNDNVSSAIGGDIQEQDVYYSLGTTLSDFSFAVTYQDWYYGGGTEQVLDFAIGYDDSELWGGDFALNPSFLVHKRLSATNIGGDTNGFAFLVGVEPGFTLIDSESYPLELAVPVTVAFGTDDFYAESGYAYFSIGAQFGLPLSFIPSEFGEWGLGFGLTYYSTDPDAIGNPDDDFVTGNIGFSVAF